MGGIHAVRSNVGHCYQMDASFTNWKDQSEPLEILPIRSSELMLQWFNSAHVFMYSPLWCGSGGP